MSLFAASSTAWWPFSIVGGTGLLMTYLLTPGVRQLAFKLGAVDVPRDRSVHLEPTPTMGGIALYAGVVAALAASMATGLRPRLLTSEAAGIVLGGGIALGLGVLDDRRELTWPAKFVGQILAAGVLYLSGASMSYFWLPWVGVLSLSPDLSALLTFLTVIMLMNAVNFVDGLDGLAAGLTAISAGAFFLYALRLESAGLLGPDPLSPVLAIAVVGACAGFLRHNFHPARIFMGDSGAMPLGFFMAAATISMVGRSTMPGPEGGRLALPLVTTPIVFLALPVFDVAFAIVRRLASGGRVFLADKDHVHHRLMRLGHSQKQAVLVMYGWALLLAGGMVLAGSLGSGRFALLFAVAGGTIALFTLSPRWRKAADDDALPVRPPDARPRRESSYPPSQDRRAHRAR